MNWIFYVAYAVSATAHLAWFFFSLDRWVEDVWSFLLWLFIIEPVGATVIAVVSTLALVPVARVASK